jgi:hypothetical protein
VKKSLYEERGGERGRKNLRMRWMRPKEQGSWAELCFMARAMEERLAPSRPDGGKEWEAVFDPLYGGSEAGEVWGLQGGVVVVAWGGGAAGRAERRLSGGIGRARALRSLTQWVGRYWSSTFGAKHGRATESWKEAANEADGAGSGCVSAVGGVGEFAAGGGGGVASELSSSVDIFSVGTMALGEDLLAAGV